MRRRRVLIAACTLATGSAGCTSRSGGAGERTTTGSATDGKNPTTTDETSPTTTDGRSPTTTDGTPGGRFADQPCPSFVDGADRTVCYHRRGSATLYLEPSTEDFQEFEDDDTVETLWLTLHNGRETTFSLNPYDWAVKRRTDSGWEHVAPGATPEPLVEVPPGSTYEWVLSTTPRTSEGGENRRSVVVDLQSGETYAFRVHGFAGEGDDSERVELVALFSYVRAVP